MYKCFKSDLYRIKYVNALILASIEQNQDANVSNLASVEQTQ